MRSINPNEEIQIILELISGLLKVDILMVDTDCKRIAGAAIYGQTSGNESCNNLFFKKASANKSTFLIYNNQILDVLERNFNIEKLTDTVHLYHSIILDDEILGVVKCKTDNLLVKKKIIEDTDSVTILINYIFSYMMIKAASIITEREESISEALINFFNDPVIYTSPDGIIEKFNDSAKEVFTLSDENIGLQLNELIININFEEIIESNSNDKRENFNFTKDSINLTGSYMIRPVFVNRKIVGIFVHFDIDKKIQFQIDGEVNRITFDDIVGTSQAIVKAKEYAFRVLKGTSTIFINGESGTGKELFARAIHNTSTRSDGPFIPINCAAIPDTLMESELFGYEEGSFTGAKKGGKPGKFELANHGTIFLDEIGDMKLSLQAKLLRVLQENVIERIGSKKSIPIDVRVIAATHEEIHEKIEDGTFRQDLFYRLSVIPIRIPPLRDRSSDIMIIAEYFLERYTEKLSKNIIGFDDIVIDKLNSYVWPGNVRELENVIEFAVNMAMNDIVHIEDLPARFYDSTHRNKELFGLNNLQKITPVHDLEIIEIKKAVELYGRSKKGIIEASKALGMSVATLYRRLRTMEKEHNS